MASVLQDWVNDLSFMQQSVLISAVRGPDGFDKDSDTKPIARWYRRCILLSAFEGKAINCPYTPGGGSFTGPIDRDTHVLEISKNYFNKMDSIPLHYYTHFMHAAQIVGYKHPIKNTRDFWSKFYLNCVNKLHLLPEPEEMMDKRLSDNRYEWLERDKDIT